MPSKKRSRRPSRAGDKDWKAIRLHARFIPNGQDTKGLLAFCEFYLAAKGQIHTKRNNDLDLRIRRLDDLEKAMPKVLTVMKEVLAGDLDPENGREIIWKLLPDEEMRRSVYDLWQMARTTEPKDLERQKAEINAREAEIKRMKIESDAHTITEETISAWSKAALEGDARAAKLLADTVSQGVLALMAFERIYPETARSIARDVPYWPILVTGEAGGIRKAVESVTALGVGESLREWKPNFRQARGSDGNYPARRWAKAAVQTAVETRWRILAYGGVVGEFGSTETFVDFIMNAGWECFDPPCWAETAAKLAPFSTDTVKDWKPVVREMIREQIPDFHTYPEWENQRRTAQAKCRDTVGEIQNAILDDIISALVRIAPDPSC